MDLVLSDEERSYLERFDALCAQRIAPRARAADRAEALPRESLAELAEIGYFGLFHPPEVGGVGARGALLAATMERLAHACAGTMWAATISTALAGKVLWNLCREAHRQRWLAPIARGEIIGCFAATEHGAGSDPGSYRTTLRRTAKGFSLSGEKVRIACAPAAAVAVVVARSEGPSGGLAYAIVDLASHGISRASIESVGLRAMPWGRIRFDDVALDEGDVILEATMERTLKSVEWGQLIQTFAAVGVAQRALDESVAHAREREAFGRPIGHLEIVHGRLADMALDIASARLLGLRAAEIMAAHRSAGEHIMMAKIHAAEMGVRVTDAALRMFAGIGFSAESDIERLHRDALGNVPGGLPTDRLRDLVMCPALGVSPWEYPPFDWLSASGLSLG